LLKRRFWLDYWQFKDPFSKEELKFVTEGFDKLLIRYDPVDEVDQILGDILSQEADIMLHGFRIGSGLV